MRLTCLGGAGEIGANSYLLEIGGQALLLDAGMHPRREGPAALPRLEAVGGIGRIDHVFVTHAHLDHVGALPAVMRAQPRARIHMTPVTHRLASRMLRNSATVMEQRHRSLGGPPPAFGFADLEVLEALIEDHPAGSELGLGRGLDVELLDAGHIAGAAGIRVRHDGRTLFYGGDTCASSQLLVPGARYPRSAEVLLLEATYGASPELDGHRHEAVVAELGRVLRAALRGGGWALIPVFALGRAQEVLFALWKLGQAGRLPPVPVHVTGLARAITSLYDETRRLAPRCDPELRLERTGFTTLGREAIEAGLPDGPAIVLASSGMVAAGTSASLLARRALSSPEASIVFVGYQDPETPGHRILESRPGQAVDLGDGREPVVRRCAVERVRFRSHSTRRELLATVRALAPRRVVLVHGDPAACASLAVEIGRDGTEVILPLPLATAAL